MTENERALAKDLASVVGEQYVDVNPTIRIDGLAPWILVKPQSPEEVAGCLGVCSDHQVTVVPAGAGTWLDSGNLLRSANVVVSLQRMSRVVDYSPADLTATVEPGLTIGEFNAVVMRERQWLPLDPPGSPGASLGAIAACASSGPLRLGFGTPRDYVIGLRLAHSNGAQSKSGGKVVKNVAGYDMNKLYVGSLGTLAVLTALTVKLRPLPDCFSTVAVTSDSYQVLGEIARQVLDAQVLPASVFVTNAVPAGLFGCGGGFWALLVQFVDTDTAVAYQVDVALKLLRRAGDVRAFRDEQAKSIWLEVANIDQQFSKAIRISVQPSTVVRIFEELEAFRDPSFSMIVAADCGVGIIRVAFDSSPAVATRIMTQLRSSLGSSGTASFEGRDFEVRRSLDVWGDAGASASLMRAIKTSFDPGSILNPGRFVAQI